MSKLVFVYSIPRQSAFGIDQWTSASGVKLKKNKVGSCADTIKALYSLKVGGLANYISYTPWIENGEVVTDDKGNKLTLQHKLEKKWNKPEGYFTNEPLAKDDNKPDGDRTFFQRMSWKLNDGCTVFDLSTMEGELGYYVLLGSSKVANSEREWRQHLWPRAEYYIALENESDTIKAQKAQQKINAFAALKDSNLSDAYKRKMVSLLELTNTRSNLTSEQCTNLLFDYIERSTYSSGSNIDKFMELYNLVQTATGREELEARYLIAQAIDLRIVYEKQGSYTWIRPEGNIVIGDRYNEAIDFLLNPKKFVEVEELTAAINAKKSN